MKRLLAFAAALLLLSSPAWAEVIEGFESGNLADYVVVGDVVASVSPAAAHDGQYGLIMAGHTGAEGWIYRDDAQVHVQQGDVISIWTRTMPYVAGTNTRNYCGFGATAAGCYSAVIGVNTTSFLIQRNTGYSYATLTEMPFAGWQPSHWYRVEIQWGVGGQIDAFCYDSDGTTLLVSASAVDNTYNNGGLAFRSFDSGLEAYFDTIERNPGAPVPAETSTWGAVKALYR